MRHKVCFKCKENKPLFDFYKHSGMSDGSVNKCKTCNKIDVRKNRKLNFDYYRSYDSKRHSAMSDQQKHIRSENSIERNRKFPNKKRANSAISNAIRDGRLVRPNICEYCGVECKPHAHHSSYSKDMFLVVTWLCPSCHNTLHKHFEFNITGNL